VRPDIVPGKASPGYEPPDHAGTARRLGIDATVLTGASK
jgi:hypothetical protein